MVVGLESLQEVSLLGVLPLVLNTRMERRNDPRFSFRVFGPPPVTEGWFPHSGYQGGVRGGSFGRKDGLDCANPTFEQMARH
jgi:hypothetical protein